MKIYFFIEEPKTDWRVLAIKEAGERDWNGGKRFSHSSVRHAWTFSRRKDGNLIRSVESFNRKRLCSRFTMTDHRFHRNGSGVLEAP